MAKVLKEIFTGADKVQQTFIINSWHVSQSVDAFTGVEDYDITVSGSLTVTGSIYHDLIPNANGAAASVLVRDNATGEYYITGSYSSPDGTGSTDYISNVVWDNTNSDLLFTGVGNAFDGTASLDQLRENGGGFTLNYSGSVQLLQSWVGGGPNKVVSTRAPHMTASGYYEWHFSDVDRVQGGAFNTNGDSLFRRITGSVTDSDQILVRVYDDRNPNYDAYYVNSGSAILDNGGAGNEDLVLHLKWIGGRGFGPTNGSLNNGSTINNSNVSFVFLGSGTTDTNTNIYNTNGSLNSNRTLDLATYNLSIDSLNGETFTHTLDSGATASFQLDDGVFQVTNLPDVTLPNVIGYDINDGRFVVMSTSSFTGSGATPAGNDTEVQFNDGGVFGADPNFTWNKTSNYLTLKGNTNSPALKLENSTPSLSDGTEIAELVARSSVFSVDIAGIIFKGDGASGGGDYPSRIEFTTTPDGAFTPTTKFQIKNDGELVADEYGSGTFTGTAAKWLAVSASGEVIEVNPPANAFTRPGSDTSVTYDTYLNTVQYIVDQVGTNPAAPNANGDVSLRYVGSAIGSNVDRIDVYKTDSGGNDNSDTLETLAVSGSINFAVTGVGAHTELYRIISITDNSTYVSYAVEWESGDDASWSTGATMTTTFTSEYEYELSTGYNRLLVTNNSTAANYFRMVPPSSANAGDEVIVELKIGGSTAVQPTYQLRNGSPSFRKIRKIYEVDGITVSNIRLLAGDTAMMKFQVNDLGSVVGLTLLGANTIIT